VREEVGEKKGRKKKREERRNEGEGKGDEGNLQPLPEQKFWLRPCH